MIIVLYILLGIYLLGLGVSLRLYYKMFVLVRRDDPKYLPKMILALIFWPVYLLIIGLRMW